MQPNVDGDASHVHSIICWRCTQPHVLGINDFITFLQLFCFPFENDWRGPEISVKEVVRVV